MKKVNASEVEETQFESPKGVYAMRDINLSHALGRKEDSTDLNEWHPFDVEICTIPAGKKMCPYHSHSAQWEFFHVISGTGTVRDEDGNPIGEHCHYPDSNKWLVALPDKRLIGSESKDYFEGEE